METRILSSVTLPAALAIETAADIQVLVQVRTLAEEREAPGRAVRVVLHQTIITQTLVVHVALELGAEELIGRILTKNQTGLVQQQSKWSNEGKHTR